MGRNTTEGTSREGSEQTTIETDAGVFVLSELPTPSVETERGEVTVAFDAEQVEQDNRVLFEYMVPLGREIAHGVKIYQRLPGQPHSGDVQRFRAFFETPTGGSEFYAGEDPTEAIKAAATHLERVFGADAVEER